MKARVYGWGNHDINDFKRFNGEVYEVLNRDFKDSYIVVADLKQYIVDKRQVETIKEIAITEEDFDNAFDIALYNCVPFDIPSMFIDKLKKELFKDVK